jgi:hypothetical protein
MHIGKDYSTVFNMSFDERYDSVMVLVFEVIHHAQLGLPAVHAKHPADGRKPSEHVETRGTYKCFINLHDTWELKVRLYHFCHIMASSSAK